MPDPVTMQFTPFAQFFASIAVSLLAGLLSIAVWYLRKLDRHIAHHKHRGCTCDKDGKGEAYFPAIYE